MKNYLDSIFINQEEIETSIMKSRSEYGKAILSILKSFDISSEMKNKVNYLLGGGKCPVGFSTEADIGNIIYRFECTLDALKQIRASDSRAQFVYRHYSLDDTSGDLRHRFDLRKRKASLATALNREFGDYLARFTVRADTNDLGFQLRVIGLQSDLATSPTTQRRKRSSHEHVANYERNLVLSGDLELAALVAQFWAPPPAYEHVDADHAGCPSAFVNQFVARGLMPTDRVCFGRGKGKTAIRHVMTQIRAKAASMDFLTQSPLQPEAIASLLALLPINADGGVPVLPPLRLL